MNGSHRLGNSNHAFLYRIRANSCRHITAVGLIIYLALADNYLTYQIFYINSRLFALPYNNDFIVGGNGSAHAVNLLRIRIAHCLKENAVPLFPFFRKVFLMKHAAFAGAAAHKYGFKCSHLISPPFLLTASVNDATDRRKESHPAHCQKAPVLP